MTISAFPLQWPTGWKRTSPTYRTEARFGKARQSSYGGGNYTPARALTIAEGVDRVMAELRRMGVDREQLVISSNLRLRLDGLPLSNQAEPQDPGVAVYWVDPFDPTLRKVMAIDIYNRVADNLAAVAATLDAMRAIERHGGAAVLERAYTGFTALPAPITADMKRNWQVVLGLDKLLQPTAADVRQAYQRLAGLYHPDRPEGNGEKMSELNAARDDALEELKS